MISFILNVKNKAT